LPIAVDVCPNPACGVVVSSLLRDLLAHGTMLHADTYHIDYPLGRGGFGVTYRAHHTRLDEPRAIKEFFPCEYVMRDAAGRITVPHSEEDAYRRGLERFVREGRLLAKLKHPSVVEVYDLFEWHGTAYLVMELIPGDTLRKHLQSQPDGRLAPDQVRAIIERLVDALETVHAHEIYHLDLKPENVLIAPRGRVALIDFGAARQRVDVTPSHKKRRTTQARTDAYAPLELYDERLDVGPESDLFELGMMVYEMLTGDLPPSALSRRIWDDHWEPLDIPDPWRRLVAAALRLEKSERPASARAWWEGAFVAGPVPPVVAPPVVTSPPPGRSIEDDIVAMISRERVPAPAPPAASPPLSLEDKMALELGQAMTAPPIVEEPHTASAGERMGVEKPIEDAIARLLREQRD
jgi:serine/threonine protein kinase